MKNKSCHSLNCKNKAELTVTVKVFGGGSVMTRLCLEHIRKALNAQQADFVLWNCVPIKKIKEEVR